VARAGSPRRSRIRRKPSRREGRCDHRLYLWFLRLRKSLLRKAPGAAATRPSLRPLCFQEGNRQCKARAKDAARARMYVSIWSSRRRPGPIPRDFSLRRGGGRPSVPPGYAFAGTTMERPACRLCQIARADVNGAGLMQGRGGIKVVGAVVSFSKVRFACCSASQSC